MDWNRIEGNWKQAQGKIKEKWGKLTDDDLTTGALGWVCIPCMIMLNAS